MNICDEFSSDEVTVYKDEGEGEVGQTIGENFGADKVELIKEAEQGPAKSTDAVKPVKDVPLNAGLERTTPATHRQLNNFSSSLFDGAGALSPSAATLFSAQGPYAALLSASRLPGAGTLSPAALGLLAAHTQQTASPAPLSADHFALLAAGIASPPNAQLAAAVAAARSSPALAALQIAAALNPYTSRSNTTTPSATPGATASDQFLAAAAGLQQLAAVAAAHSPGGWAGGSNSTAASNWLYAGGAGLQNAPVGGGLASPALAGCGSPSASLLARLSPALSTLQGLQCLANLPQATSSFLLNAAAAQHQSNAEVHSPSSAVSSVISGLNAYNSAPETTEAMFLRSVLQQHQQQQQQQQQERQQQERQQLASILDAAQMVMANSANQSHNTTPNSNVPVTPRSKQITIPTPTSRPRPQPQMDPSSTPLALTSSIAGIKRPLNSLAQTTRPDHHQQHSPMMPMHQQQQQQLYHGQQQLGSPSHHHSAFHPMDARRQAHMLQQQQPHLQQHPAMNMAHHHQGIHPDHHLSGHGQHRSRSPPMNPNEPHVKKPLNAFMLFMKEQRAQVIAECTLKESAAINQILGQRWHNLSRDEQARYYDLAKAEKERHQQLYPNWSARENYASQAKKKRRRKTSGYPTGPSLGGLGPGGLEGGLKDPRDAALKKCRARYGVDQMDKWCKPCRRKKKCARYYNLPGADDDNEGGVDAKSTPSSHMGPGMMPAMCGGPGSIGGGSGMSHHRDLTSRYGSGADGPDDDWGSDSGSSMGDSVDEDEDEEQLNAFHLVTESSSGSSTPSPSPAIMHPLSPSSSVHSSASHRPLHAAYPQPHVMAGMVKMQPGTPTSAGMMSSDFMQQMGQSGMPGLQQQQQAPLFLGVLGDPNSIHPPPTVPAGTASSSSASSEIPPQPQLSSTPPSSTSAGAPHQLCSPNSSSTGIAFRPLLPAN